MEEKIVKNKIVCPYCGAEYMAAEIYYPDSLVGKPFNIVKDDNGKLEYWSGDDMDVIETYTCDHCNKDFAVTADIKFTAQPVVKNDFDDVYESKLYPGGRLTLEEN